MGTINYVVAGVVLCLLLTKCSAIRCFSCNSKDYRCGDNFRLTNVEAKECSGSCNKMRGITWESGVRYVQVVRGCEVQTSDKCYDKKIGEIDFEVCICNSNFCNHGNTVRSLLPLIIISFILSSSK